jgi:methylthioribose-1-phosphate isomerase
MTTRSTASSGTEPKDPDEARHGEHGPAPSAPIPAAAGHDPGRRAFFLQFGKQAATAAGQVAGMADIVGRTSSALAGELLGLDAPRSEPGSAGFARAGVAGAGVARAVVSSAAPAAEHAFRSAYRLTDQGVVILDQRRLPESLEEVVARRGSDVAYYLRLGVARGGPLMAQLAAYGLALTAAERADRPAPDRQLELRRTERALVEARPSSRLLAWAVERLRAVAAGAGETATGAAEAAALRAAADAIAAEITTWEAGMATSLAEALPEPGSRPLAVLLHGAHGPLVAGQLGAGLAALRQLRDAGRSVRVFVTEGRPFMDGARLAAWELRQAGIDHRIVPDAAAAWLFDREPIDALLVRAEWVAANGDTGALIGARALARLASTVEGERPRIVAIGPTAAQDPSTSDASAIPPEMRPATELSAYLAEVPVRPADALVPAADVIPAGLVDLRVTEAGVVAGESGR